MKYRFAVIDPTNFKGYPANFVCVLPRRIIEKGKPESAFGRLFGDRSSEYAVELLKEALEEEKDEHVRTEIEQRLNLLKGKRPKLRCSSCHQEFEEFTRIRYKRSLCRSCLQARIPQDQA